ncbi:MAG: hypothetical protein FD167_2359 [bacterium]|nr:MAG: hypothetical protein FD167_2359 [bacterium]
MKKGDVVITSILQADGKIKNRPTIILCEMPPYNDFLVCGISTRLHQYASGFDELIAPTDSDFGSSRLLSKSIIRLGFLTVIPDKDIVGVIGNIAPERHKKILDRLGNYLIFKSIEK